MGSLIVYARKDDKFELMLIDTMHEQNSNHYCSETNRASAETGSGCLDGQLLQLS
jgi:hypothetical protein